MTDEELKQLVARIHEEVFTLDVPANFKPKAW
jgi:hypothetical protein